MKRQSARPAEHWKPCSPLNVTLSADEEMGVWCAFGPTKGCSMNHRLLSTTMACVDSLWVAQLHALLQPIVAAEGFSTAYHMQKKNMGNVVQMLQTE